MYTVYQAQPVISILYLMTAKYKCAFVGSNQLDRPSARPVELKENAAVFQPKPYFVKIIWVQKFHFVENDLPVLMSDVGAI